MYYNNHDVRVEEMPVPEIGPGELLVKVEASGICGSDVMEWYRIQRAPMVLGHEVAGTIVQAGAGVERFKEGDRQNFLSRFAVRANEVPAQDVASKPTFGVVVRPGLRWLPVLLMSIRHRRRVERDWHSRGKLISLAIGGL